MRYNYVPEMSLTKDSLDCCKQQIIKSTHSEQMQVTAVCDQTQTQAHAVITTLKYSICYFMKTSIGYTSQLVD